MSVNIVLQAVLPRESIVESPKRCGSYVGLLIRDPFQASFALPLPISLHEAKQKALEKKSGEWAETLLDEYPEWRLV